MKKAIKNILSWVIPIAIGIALALLIRQYVFTMAKVNGPSMQPNLENNERIVVMRMEKVKPLSVIVFDAHGEDPEAEAPNTDYVKRVIGMPGQTVEYKNGGIYVNNKRIDENFISKSQQSPGSSYNGIPGNWSIKSLAKTWPKNRKAVKVPKNEYFVMGDHRSVSNDSRYWGFVPVNKVTGVVKTLPWSTTKQKRHNIDDLAK